MTGSPPSSSSRSSMSEPGAGVAGAPADGNRARSARSWSSTRSRPRSGWPWAVPPSARRPARPDRARQGAGERIPARGGRRPPGGHGRRRPHLDLVHPGHRVRVARRRAGHARRGRAGAACPSGCGCWAPACSTGSTGSARRHPERDHRRGRRAGDVLSPVRRRRRVSRAGAGAARPRDSSSSGRPTTSCRWRTTPR